MILIGHRGASGHSLENSISSFNRAIEMKVDYIELDIQETADGRFIVFHDYYLERCTGAIGNVRDYSFGHIRENIKLNNDEVIPSLEEICSFAKDNHAKLIIELKTDNAAKKVSAIVERFLEKTNFIIGSFFHEQLVDLKQQFNDTQTCAMFECYPIEVEEYIKKLEVNFAAVGFESTNQSLVERIQSVGVKVFTWTVNEVRDLKTAHDMNVNGIITNYPDRLKQVLRGQ